MSNVSASDAPALVTRLFDEHASAIRRYFRRQLRETGAADDLSHQQAGAGAEYRRRAERQRSGPWGGQEHGDPHNDNQRGGA